MELDILTGGSEYISATRASEKTGYSGDYIGQLCRAKKIPGKLIGRTWYVDFEALAAHKKSRKLGRVRGTRLAKFRNEPTTHLLEVAASPRTLTGVEFKYEFDDRPLLPVLTKRVITEDDGPREFAVSLRMTAVTLSLALMVGIGYFGTARISPALSRTQPASVSLFSAFEDVVDFVVGGFQDLKSFAVSGFMDSSVPPVRTNTPSVAVVPNRVEVPVKEAVTAATAAITPPVVATNLKAELMAYLETRIAGIASSPVTVYQAGPTFNTTVLRSDILVDDTRPAISRQSDSDSNRTTTLLSRVTNEGTFVSPTITGGSISNASGAFTQLTAINATSSTFAITGDGSGLVFYGSGNHDISAAAGTLRIGSNTIIGNVEALDNSVDIGTPGVRFDKIYANEVNASTLVGTLTGGNLIAETFNINSDNATADTENGYLSFERGTAAPNALLTWNSTDDRFELNSGLSVVNTIGSAYGLLVTGGKVGFGTTTPAVSLDIFGTDAMRIPVGTTLQRPTGGIGMVRFNTTTHTFEGYSDSGVWQGLGGVIDTDQDTYITADTGGVDEDAIRFYTAGTEKVSILSSGYVGIGTTTPNSQFHVHGSSQTVANFQSADTQVYQRFSTVNDSSVYVGNNAGTYLVQTNAISRLAITNGGNIGIGTTTPNNKLDIYSTAKSAIGFSGAGDSTYKWTMGMDVTNGGRFAISSSTALGTTDRFVITGNGNVGINTSAPSGKFTVQYGAADADRFIMNSSGHLAGESNALGTKFRLQVNSNDVGLFLASDNSVGFANGTNLNSAGLDVAIKRASSGVLEVNSGTSGQLRDITLRSASTTGQTVLATTDGRVGIGTTAPGGKLSISKAWASGDRAFQVTDSSGFELFSLYADGGNPNTLLLGGWGGAFIRTRENESLSLIVSGGASQRFMTSSTERMTITSGGKVGIGTTTPPALLSINDPAGVDSFYIGSSTPKLIVKDNGTVGIGTTSPAALAVGSPAGTILDISHSNGGTLTLHRGSGSLHELSIYAGSNGNFIDATGDATASNNAIIFRTSNTNSSNSVSEAMRILSSGNVGIGTTNPGAKFAVETSESGNYVGIMKQTHSSPYGLWINYTNAAPNGSSNQFIYASDNAALRFEVRSSGGIANYSANNVNLSDERMKNVFGNAPSELERFSQLNFVLAEYKDNPLETKDVMLLAQQVQTIYPELVTIFDETKGTLGIRDGALALRAYKALQDLNLKVESLTSSTPMTGSLGERAITNIIAKIKEWLASAANGITEMIAGTFRAKDKLCINDTCVTEQQLQALLANAGSSSSSSGSTSSGGGEEGTSPSSEGTGSTSTTTDSTSGDVTEPATETAEDSSSGSVAVPDTTVVSEPDTTSASVSEDASVAPAASSEPLTQTESAPSQSI